MDPSIYLSANLWEEPVHLCHVGSHLSRNGRVDLSTNPCKPCLHTSNQKDHPILHGSLKTTNGSLTLIESGHVYPFHQTSLHLSTYSPSSKCKSVFKIPTQQGNFRHHWHILSPKAPKKIMGIARVRHIYIYRYITALNRPSSMSQFQDLNGRNP